MLGRLCFLTGIGTHAIDQHAALALRLLLLPAGGDGVNGRIHRLLALRRLL